MTSRYVRLALLFSVRMWLSSATAGSRGQREISRRSQAELKKDSVAHSAAQSSSELQILARGELVRRQAESSSHRSHQKSLSPGDVESDGVVEIVAPASTDSEKTKLEELTEECMQDLPTSECMEKFGSYGVRKLYTETWDNINKLGYTRPGWMSHPEVQKRRFFDITFPGTVSSGTFAITGEDAVTSGNTPFGIVSQNLDFYQQLQLGVRAFEIRVAYSTEAKLVYISHGALMMPFATALRDMRRFLEEHEREVIILDVKKDPNADVNHLQPLHEEETTPSRVPGQLVHEAAACELKEMLATYAVLTQLPGNEQAENPTIGALTNIGAQVIYYWDTQQVLCTTFDECSTTYGWWPADSGNGMPFAFGAPYELGTRINVVGGQTLAKIIEPGCLTHSTFYTQDDQPEMLLKKIKTFAKAQASKTAESRPKCFPASAPFPAEHSPTIMYTVDGYVTSTPEEQNMQADRMRGVKAIYTRGEGYTARTDSERTNYLLLTWFFKKGNQELFTKPNLVLFEFAGSAAVPILRIIEAMQGRPECGYAIYCKDTGSCWADTMLGAEDKCIPEDDVLKKLEDHAEVQEDTTRWVIYVTVVGVSFLVTVCACCCIVKMFQIMKGPRRDKEVEEPLAEAEVTGEDNEVPDHESTLPGSEAASDYEPPEETEGAGVVAP
jgi:hypothetical protein